MDQAHVRDLVGRNPRADPDKIKAAFDLLDQAGFGDQTAYALSLPYTRPVATASHDVDGESGNAAPRSVGRSQIRRA